MCKAKNLDSYLLRRQRADPCSIQRWNCLKLHSENLKGWIPSSPLKLDFIMHPCQSVHWHTSSPSKLMGHRLRMFPQYNWQWIYQFMDMLPLEDEESSCPKPRLWPIAWARLLARMWGSNGLTSTLIPTDLSVQILPTLAVVVSPILNLFRPLQRKKNIFVTACLWFKDCVKEIAPSKILFSFQRMRCCG